MKKNTKKGFTLTELVIVIAVIAILAAVLIPTFANVVKQANKSAALQAATSAYKEAMAECLADDGVITADEEATSGDFTFTFTTDGEFDATVETADDSKYSEYNFAVEDGVVVVTED